MRRTCLLILIFYFCLSLKAADVEFVRVWPRYRDVNTFRFVSEYFNGVEENDGIIIERTQPKSRSGYYFFVRLKHTTISLKGAHFSVQFITPYWIEGREKTFPAVDTPGEQKYLLGLTGSDWTGRETHPIAWKVDLISEDGKILSSSQSFLWSKPPAHG